jgi:hypothetical protein
VTDFLKQKKAAGATTADLSIKATNQVSTAHAIFASDEAATAATRPQLVVAQTPPPANAPRRSRPGRSPPKLTARGNQADLSVRATDDGGEANLRYTWSVVSYQPTHLYAEYANGNGTNAAKDLGSRSSGAGTYTLRVTVSDGTRTTTADFAVVVDRRATR